MERPHSAVEVMSFQTFHLVTCFYGSIKKNEIIQTNSMGLAWMLTLRLASGVFRFNSTLTSSPLHQ